MPTRHHHQKTCQINVNPRNPYTNSDTYPITRPDFLYQPPPDLPMNEIAVPAIELSANDNIASHVLESDNNNIESISENRVDKSPRIPSPRQSINQQFTPLSHATAINSIPTDESDSESINILETSPNVTRYLSPPLQMIDLTAETPDATPIQPKRKLENTLTPSQTRKDSTPKRIQYSSEHQASDTIINTRDVTTSTSWSRTS